MARDIGFTITVKGTEQQLKKIGLLERALKTLGARRTELVKKSKTAIGLTKQEQVELGKLTVQLKELSDQKRKTTTAVKDLNKEIKSATGSYNKLVLQNKRLVSELRRLPDPLGVNKKRFTELSTSINNNTNRLKQMDAAIGRQQRNVGNYSGVLKGLKNSFVAISASVTAAVIAFRQFNRITQGAAEFSDVLADVRKTTGLTTEEISKLVKELQKIDTRTSVTELLKIAEAGGRLAIEGDELLDFIVSIDKAVVSLGDILEGDAGQIATDLGKIVALFGVQEEFGIAEGITKVGSAINAIGASTRANEKFIVDFTKRLGAIAPLANISVSDIIGLAATLDSFGQRTETSATAVAKLLKNLGTDVAEFAEIAGIGVEEFTEIVSEDANEAFLLLLEGAKSSEKGLIGLTDTLERLGISSDKAAGVAGILVAKIEDLRANQESVNEAFVEGISIDAEFQIKNENLAASISKLNKQFAILVQDTGFIDFLNRAVKASINLIEFFKEAPRRLTALLGPIGLVVTAFREFATFIGLTATNLRRFGNNVQRLASRIGLAKKPTEELKKGIDEVDKSLEKAGETADDAGDKFKGLTQAQKNQITQFRRLVDETRAFVTALSKAEVKQLSDAVEKENKKISEIIKKNNAKILSLQRQLVDSQFAIQEDDDKKKIAQLEETLRREIEDLEAQKGEVVEINDAIDDLIEAKKAEHVKVLEDIDKNAADKKQAEQFKNITLEQQIAINGIRTAEGTEEEKQQAILLIQIEFAKKRLELLKTTGDLTLAEVRLQISTLEALITELTAATEGEEVTGIAKLLGITPEEADVLINKALQITKTISDAIFQSQREALKRQTELRLTEIQQSADTELKILQNRLDKGIISEEQFDTQKAKIDEKANQRQLAAEKEAFESNKRLAKQQALIAGALAILTILATSPDILKPIGPLFLTQVAGAVATTAANIAVISATKFKKGGELVGPSHAQGGIKAGGVEFEGREGVVNARSMSSQDVISVTGTPKQVASAANTHRNFGIPFDNSGRKKFQFGGTVPTPNILARESAEQLGQEVGATLEEVGQLITEAQNTQVIQVVESDITDTQKDVSVIESLSE